MLKKTIASKSAYRERQMIHLEPGYHLNNVSVSSIARYAFLLTLSFNRAKTEVVSDVFKEEDTL